MKGLLRSCWNTKHYIITTIRRTAAHLYHTMNHHRVQLPQGASITWCTYHTLHDPGCSITSQCTDPSSSPTTRSIYDMVHLPHSAPTQALHAPTTQCTYRVVHPGSSITTQCTDPSTSCTYHTVHLPRGSPRFLNYHTVYRPKHFMHLPHSDT